MDDDGFQRQSDAGVSDGINVLQVSYCQLVTTPRVIFAALATGLGNTVYAEMEPILALRV